VGQAAKHERDRGIAATPKVSVLYFAQAREATGTGQEAMTLSDHSTIEALLLTVSKTHPKLAAMKRSIRVAVNSQLAEPRTVLHEGDEVALLPPVAGG
jgi:molybdopterin converting factor subunit 1